LNVVKDSEVFGVFVHGSSVHKDMGGARQARWSSLDAWITHRSCCHCCQAIRTCL